MPEDKDSKSHYSYEEMVTRLRDSRPASRVKSEEREVDPETGVVTVRRQKKRRETTGGSGRLNSPKRKNTWAKYLWLVLPVLVVLLGVSYIIMVAAAGSGRFRSGLGESLSRDLGLVAPIELEDTSLSGLTLNIRKATLPGLGGGMFHGGSAEGVELRLHPSSFFGGDWDVSTCVVNKALVLIGVPTEERVDTGQAGAPSSTGFLLSHNPEEIHFPDITLGKANVVFGGTDPATSPGLRSSRISLLHRNKDKDASHYDCLVTGGRDGLLVLPAWPDFKVETMQMEIRNTGITLNRSVLHLASTAENADNTSAVSTIKASGQIPFGIGQSAAIELGFRGVLSADLLPKASSRFIAGVMRADAVALKYDTRDPKNTWQLTGPVTMDLTRLHNMRLITLLQRVVGGELPSLDFDQTTFLLDMTPEHTELKNIKAVDPGRVQLSGQLEVGKEGKLSGTINLGLSQDVLVDKLPELFKPAADGYAWVTIAIAGNASAPSDDLTPKLQAWLDAKNGRKGIDPDDFQTEDDTGDKINGNMPSPPSKNGKSDAQRLKGLYDDLLDSSGDR